MLSFLTKWTSFLDVWCLNLCMRVITSNAEDAFSMNLFLMWERSASVQAYNKSENCIIYERNEIEFLYHN